MAKNYVVVHLCGQPRKLNIIDLKRVIITRKRRVPPIPSKWQQEVKLIEVPSFMGGDSSNTA